MNYYKELFLKGKEKVKDKRLLIHGMVKNAGKELAHNILALEKIGDFFQDYRIVIMENNSTDNTKQVLQEWQRRNPKVIALINDFDESKYKAIPVDNQYSVYFQKSWTQKMFDYRNMVKDYIDNLDFESDYTILVDPDVANIDPEGVITSFGSDIEWDSVTANGYSLSPLLKRRYHDTFAFCEYGLQNQKQTLQMLIDNSQLFAFLRKGMPFIRVFSAYGGLAIYKTDAIKGMKYKMILNEFGGIQTRCEHFCLCAQMAEKGRDKVFINPNMEIYYQKISFALIKKKISSFLKK